MYRALRRERETTAAARLGPRLALAAAALTAGSAAPISGTRVLVFNIHAGKDAAGKDNLDRVAALVKSTRADLVLHRPLLVTLK